MVFGGFIVPSVVASAFEGVGPDLPNELYGVATVAGNEKVLDQRMVSLGGGLYVVDSLASRVGLQNQVSDLARGA